MDRDFIYRALQNGSPEDHRALLALFAARPSFASLSAALLDSPNRGAPVTAFGMLTVSYCHGVDPRRQAGRNAPGPTARHGAAANRRPWPCPTGSLVPSFTAMRVAAIAMGVLSPSASRIPRTSIAGWSPTGGRWPIANTHSIM
jgi:hypothetical protein